MRPRPHSITAKLIFYFLITLPLSSLQVSCVPTTSFPPLGKVTKIEIVNNVNTRLKKIEDAEQIGKIVAFVHKNSAGWGGLNDLAGVPIPKIAINFYDGSKFKGHFGIGSNFFETQRNGELMSKSASESDIDEMLGLLHVDKSVLEN